MGALLEASARHDGQVDRPPEVNQVLLRQVVDLVSGFGTQIAVARWIVEKRLGGADEGLARNVTRGS